MAFNSAKRGAKGEGGDLGGGRTVDGAAHFQPRVAAQVDEVDRTEIMLQLIAY